MDPATIGTMVQAGSSAVGTIYNIADQLWGKDPVEQQYEYEKEFMERQHKMNLASMEQANAYQNAMYDKTFKMNTPEAKMKLFKEAGLNPALMYSGGASNIGGSTTGSASALPATKGQAPNTVGAKQVQVQQTGMALQMAKLASEIAVNQSTARKLNTEADYTAGAKTTETTAHAASLDESIRLIAEQTKSEKIKRYGMQLANFWQEIDNEVKLETKAYVMEEAKYKVEKIQGEAQSAGAKGQIDQATIETMINQHNANVENTIANTILTNAKTKLTIEQARATTEKIKQEYYDLLIKTEGQDIQREALTNAIVRTMLDNNAAMDRVTTQVVGQMLQSLVKAIPFSK